MYKLDNVTKKYQNGRNTVGALGGVNLTITDGEWLAIQGPTGHGKTTLLQMLGALDRPTSGSVQFNGQPSELSGGQQQRVAIARALVKQPSVLLADEPTGNLDEDTRDEIIGLLEGLWRDRGLTLVLVTHDSPIARRAQRIGVMRDGKLSIKHDTRPSPG